MPEQNNRCADVVPSTLAKAGVAIEQHQKNEERGEFNVVVWARAIIGKAIFTEELAKAE